MRQDHFVRFMHLALHEVAEGLCLTFKVAVTVDLLKCALVLGLDRLLLLGRSGVNLLCFLHHHLFEDVAGIRRHRFLSFFFLFIVFVILLLLLLGSVRICSYKLLSERTQRHLVMDSQVDAAAPACILLLMLQVGFFKRKTRRKVSEAVLVINKELARQQFA
jgi:hypothetical protein